MFFSYSYCAIKDEITKTIVRVQSGNKVSTGFFWRDGKTVVTTLHSLESTNNIEIWVPKIHSWKDATLIKTFRDADLILLRISNYASNEYISEQYKSKPQTDLRCFTIGYYQGNPNYIDRDFTVGLFEGNTLSDFLPGPLRPEIEALGFPSLSAEIVYLKGNLLHGFSGAPILDFEGKLIGIADGGLENGAASISWCISAIYISNLENSVENVPELNSKRINTLFASEECTNKDSDHDYFVLDHYKFIKIKTRTFDQLDLTGKYSIADNLGLNQLVSGFSNFFNVKSFTYDIYIEEISGATIALPSGLVLTNEDGMLVCGTEKIKLYLTLVETNDIQQSSYNFEASLMPNNATSWISDPNWSYPYPYPGPNNSLIRRKAYFGNFYTNYLFDALACKGHYFLGVAAMKNNQLIVSQDDLQEWAQFAIGIQLSSFSN
jgi:hypothetical protein